MAVPETKTCLGCERELPAEAFDRFDRHGGPHLRPRCHPCALVYNRGRAAHRRTKRRDDPLDGLRLPIGPFRRWLIAETARLGAQYPDPIETRQERAPGATKGNGGIRELARLSNTSERRLYGWIRENAHADLDAVDRFCVNLGIHIADVYPELASTRTIAEIYPPAPTADVRVALADRYLEKVRKRRQLVAKLHADGATLEELGERFGLSDSTLRSDIVRGGGRVRGKHAIAAELRAQVAAFAREGLTAPEIAARLSCSRNVVYRIVGALDLSCAPARKRNPPRPCPPVPTEAATLAEAA